MAIKKKLTKTELFELFLELIKSDKIWFDLNAVRLIESYQQSINLLKWGFT
jgi:hypothetical protein